MQSGTGQFIEDNLTYSTAFRYVGLLCELLRATVLVSPDPHRRSLPMLPAHSNPKGWLLKIKVHRSILHFWCPTLRHGPEPLCRRCLPLV